MNRIRALIAADDRGQSLVELALMLPLLLLIVLGLVDVGRVYAAKAGTMNAAREAALYAARDPSAPALNVTLPDGTAVRGICQHARDEMGAGSAVDPCSTSPITITCARGGVYCDSDATGLRLYQNDGAGGAVVTVTVAYDLPLLSGYLIGSLFQVNPVRVQGTATFVGLGE